MWAREEVDSTTVIRTDRAQTGVYFVTHDAAGHHFLHYRTNSPAALYAAADLPRAAIAAAKMFFVSGISQGISTSAADAVFAAIDIAREHGVKVAYDTNYRPRLWPPARAAAVMHAAIAQADYVFPGMEDALVLTGLSDPDAILDFYLGLGCPVVVLKMGEAGAYLGGRRAPRAHRAASGAGGGRHRRGRHVLRRVPCAYPGRRHAGAGGTLCQRGGGAEMHRRMARWRRSHDRRMCCASSKCKTRSVRRSSTLDRGRFAPSLRPSWFALSHKAEGSCSKGFTKKAS